MGAAGLTHGGFYRHFASKDELAGLAAARAITAQAETLGDERAFIEGYLSPEHRDDVAHGCVVSALGPELARADEPVREAFVEAYRALRGPLRATASRRSRSWRRWSARSSSRARPRATRSPTRCSRRRGVPCCPKWWAAPHGIGAPAWHA